METLIVSALTALIVVGAYLFKKYTYTPKVGDRVQIIEKDRVIFEYLGVVTEIHPNYIQVAGIMITTYQGNRKEIEEEGEWKFLTSEKHTFKVYKL